ncbi:unnamed protein product [Tuber melanosporum]|uniref:(Perigord truffle) hypothetical protein n=1 Tax=Tuber melanosporum (strain Mel28) TaxID=656061 RepID=D5GKD3_TUBMM|nr:uncharacterized protein GSTUM_00009487001 [Tuber melanosporum]CAZ84976.1 unnamed protein product [Tuber melanosporum]
MVNPILLLRVTQGVLAFIVLGVAAYVVDGYDGAVDAANFLVFDSVWTFIALGYVVVTPMFFPNFHNRWAVLGVEAITMVFWFAGFVALAAGIDRLRCDRQGRRLHLGLLNGLLGQLH